MAKIPGIMIVLLSSTFLSAPAIAYDVSVDSLNNLTGPKISWSNEASETDTGSVTIGEQTFYYTYNKPDNYTETSTRVNNTLVTADVDKKVFTGITGTADGGAIYIYNQNYSNINIQSDFIGNYSSGIGGGIYNYSDSTIGDIIGDFISNYAGRGGAIFNMYSAAIGNISGNFINNNAKTGGAISNHFATIGDITGNFIGNYASGMYSEEGGAIYNCNSTIGDITGDFIGNYVQNASGPSTLSGGAIYNYSNSTIGNITGDFISNYTYSSASNSHGGAIDNYNNSTIGDITGDFINNYAKGTFASGGAISNTRESIIGNITGDFIGNYAQATSSDASGGAIYNNGPITNIVNSNFINNYVRGNEESKGGAIYNGGADLLITADNGTSLFDGNKVNGESNAIYMNSSELNLSSLNNGTITFNDAIDGETYNINISGDGTGVVKFNNIVNHVTNFTLGANSITHLGLNSKVYAQNMNVASSSIITPGDVSSPIITVDVEVDKANNTVNTGQIFVDGDIDGQYRVLVNALNEDVLDNTEDAVVPFLFAPADDESTSSSFSVARVIGSPYLWEGSVNAEGETEGSTWYLNLTDQENPDYGDDDPEPTPVVKDYAPEVIAGIGLHEAAIEQTRSVVHNVKGKVAAGREFCPRCGMYDYGWDNSLLRNAWVLAQGESANIDKPVDMEAKIWGLEAGFDIQNDLHNTLGVFASYRKGEYDLSGKGKFHTSIGSEIDIDSYLAGLYYRYDRYLVWAFATIYGGVQQADVKTDDGMAKFDTDGVEFGASIEVGRTIPLAKDLMLDPSVGLYYTQVNFDDADDNVGKHYEWDDIKHLEAELSAKLEKQFDNAKVYVKPSVIRTFTNGDSVVISGMNKASTYKDQTLGRVEIGGRYGFTDALSAYAWANYTFGSSYDAYALGAGMSYAW